MIVAFAVAGCGSVTTPPVGHTPVQGGVATYALNPATTVNYIFPFMKGKYFSIVNTDNLQYLLYRPLYWYGGHGQPYLNTSLSLAYPAEYQGNVVTIKLKHYRWSDGTPVTADDVVFWMNMMTAEAPQGNWGGYVPHDFPDNVKSVQAVSPTVVRMVLKTKTFSRTWFDYNELSQITPMPQGWDRTANGKSDCTHQVSDCAAVYKYLDSQAQNPPSWPRSSLWGIVDGPWKLTSYISPGELTFQFNHAYSGTELPKDHITTFKEIPFTSEEAEYNVLQAQGSGTTLDVGYLPTVDASLLAPGQNVGQNLVSGYRLQALYTWGLSYFPYNFRPEDPQAAIFRQLYFREAFQDLMNQQAVIYGPLHGYGKLTTGVVGDFPQTKYLSGKAKKGDPYPFNPVAATGLLRAHGWVKGANGVTTCKNSGTGTGQCGRGVAAGAQLQFTIDYVNGLAWLEAELLQLKANALQVGMRINLVPMDFNALIGMVVGDCGPAGNGHCSWQLADWGCPGWSYSPDFMPTGEELFQTKAVANLGYYHNVTNDKLIAETLQSSNPRLMWRWEDFLTSKLPVVLQPDAPYQLVESKGSLQVGVQSPTLSINPEDWYYVR